MPPATGPGPSSLWRGCTTPPRWTNRPRSSPLRCRRAIRNLAGRWTLSSESSAGPFGEKQAKQSLWVADLTLCGSCPVPCSARQPRLRDRRAREGGPDDCVRRDGRPPQAFLGPVEPLALVKLLHSRPPPGRGLGERECMADWFSRHRDVGPTDSSPAAADGPPADANSRGLR